MISAQVLQFCGYLNTFLLFAIIGLFLFAQFKLRPNALDRLPFVDRVKISLKPVPGEAALFGPDTQKLKAFRLAWTVIVILLILRVTIGMVASKLISDIPLGS